MEHALGAPSSGSAPAAARLRAVQYRAGPPSPGRKPGRGQPRALSGAHRRGAPAAGPRPPAQCAHVRDPPTPPNGRGHAGGAAGRPAPRGRPHGRAPRGAVQKILKKAGKASGRRWGAACTDLPPSACPPKAPPHSPSGILARPALTAIFAAHTLPNTTGSSLVTPRSAKLRFVKGVTGFAGVDFPCAIAPKLELGHEGGGCRRGFPYSSSPPAPFSRLRPRSLPWMKASMSPSIMASMLLVSMPVRRSMTF